METVGVVLETVGSAGLEAEMIGMVGCRDASLRILRCGA